MLPELHSSAYAFTAGKRLAGRLPIISGASCLLASESTFALIANSSLEGAKQCSTACIFSCRCSLELYDLMAAVVRWQLELMSSNRSKQHLHLPARFLDLEQSLTNQFERLRRPVNVQICPAFTCKLQPGQRRESHQGSQRPLQADAMLWHVKARVLQVWHRLHCMWNQSAWHIASAIRGAQRSEGRLRLLRLEVLQAGSRQSSGCPHSFSPTT